MNVDVRIAKPEKTPTCISELKWYHPFLDNYETADCLLMQLGEVGQYLIRPSSTPGAYSLSVRTKSSVKHFQIIVQGDEISFGMAKFHKFSDFLKHFESQPLLAGSSGEPVLLKSPFMLPKHKTLHEYATVHGQMKWDVSSSEMAPKKSGYLIKQGGFVKTWKERWCVVNDYSLKYYQRPGDTIPKGVIDFRDCTFCRKEFRPGEIPGRENVFLLGTPWRTFIFEAATLSDLESWVVAVQDSLKAVKKFKM